MVGTRKGLSVVAGAAAAAVVLAAPVAHASPFTLGAFVTYGLLVNDGGSGGDINTPPVNANIGVGNLASGTINLNNEVINGKVDCETSCSTVLSGSAITGTWPVSLGGGPTSPPPVTSNVAAVETAITAAKTLSSHYGAESGLGTAVTLTGSTTINASSGFLDGTGTRVFTASTFSPGNSQTITINGTSSDFVVIDVTGTGNSLNGALTLAGGITSDQVLINFIGVGGSVQGAANGATLDGTFLIPNEAVTLNSLTIDGHLFGGEAGQNFQFVSNAFINQPPVPVPAPPIDHGILAFMAVGGMLFGARLLGNRRNRHLQAA